MYRWKKSRDKTILINYFNLESLVDHSNNYQKYLSSAVLKDIAPEIFCKLFVAEFIFSRILCFQHVFVNRFRGKNLNYENCSLRRILF